jgi:hypothetical protein
MEADAPAATPDTVARLDQGSEVGPGVGRERPGRVLGDVRRHGRGVLSAQTSAGELAAVDSNGGFGSPASSQAHRAPASMRSMRLFSHLITWAACNSAGRSPSPGACRPFATMSWAMAMSAAAAVPPPHAGHLDGQTGQQFTAEYQAGHLHHHSREDIAGFLAGLELIKPSITEARAWRAPRPADWPATPWPVPLQNCRTSPYLQVQRLSFMLPGGTR